ncbi:hypothetical protein DSO57_1028935 [Entomophthora muscae]|uniref:Uncharacterized protein n=1 Tax=Entomophthora muscae TaxID=34485 RepID=A0ACC2UM63_9FUNG|nr:hypothetical protein DSO57_1028935 [Entomophthora muscae]
MKPPITPKPMPASATKLPLDHTNKLFGTVYITLTGVIDTIVVNSLPPLALDCTIFPRRTKKGPKISAKPLNYLGDLAHTVDERFVLAYPTDPLPLVAPPWEETLHGVAHF